MASLTKKLLAVLLSLSLTASNVGGSVAESNMWKERSASLAGLSRMQSIFTAPASVIPQPSGGPAAQTSRLTFLADVAPFAEIRETFLSSNPNAPLVIHFQDIHEVEEVQKNIAAAVDVLNKRAGVTLVGIEGAAGPLKLEPFRASTEAAHRKAVAGVLMKAGYIGGPEFAGLSMDKAPLLWGVENKDLYLQNVDDVNRARKETAALEKIKNDQTTKLDALGKKLTSSPVIEFARRFRAYQDRGGLSNYAGFLLSRSAVEAKKFPQLKIFAEAASLEKNLNLDQVEIERNNLIRELAGRLSLQEMKALVEASAALKSKRLSFTDYDGLLSTLCARARVPLNRRSHLALYRRYQSLVEKIDGTKLFTEVARCEKTLEERFFVSKSEKEFLRSERLRASLLKLETLELTADEWFGLEKAEETRGLDSFKNFYRHALARNDALSDNLLSKMSETKSARAVLVAGGFHTEGLTRRFRSKNISYAVLSPRVTALPETKNPFKAFDSFSYPLEKLFAGRPVNLIPPRLTAADPAGVPASKTAAAELLTGTLSSALDIGVDNTAQGQILEKIRRHQESGNDFSTVEEFKVSIDGRWDSAGLHRVFEYETVAAGQRTRYRVLLTKDADLSRRQLASQGWVDDDALKDGTFLLGETGLTAIIYRQTTWRDAFLNPFEKIKRAWSGGTFSTGETSAEIIVPVAEWVIFYALPMAAGILSGFSSPLSLFFFTGIFSVLVFSLAHLLLDVARGKSATDAFTNFLLRLVLSSGLHALQFLPFLATPVFAPAGTLLNIYAHSVWNYAARRRGWAMLSLASTQTQEEINAENLAALGLSKREFRKLTREQLRLQRELMQKFPSLAVHIFSLRFQQRFSTYVLREVKKDQRPDRLDRALSKAYQHYLGDLAVRAMNAKYNVENKTLDVTDKHLFELDIPGAAKDQTDTSLKNFLKMAVKRSLDTNDPVLFNEETSGDPDFMDALREAVGEQGAVLSIIWAHPFTEQHQLVGHRVPSDKKDALVYGLGELVRHIRKAQARPDKKFILLIKNIEAMDPEVRTQLQEVLRIGELTHPELGLIKLPPNFQILLTKHEESNIADASFYDRVVVKKASALSPAKDQELEWPHEISERNYLSNVGFRKDGSQPVLTLPLGIEIKLDPELFANTTKESLLDDIFDKTGLVLDFDTVRMLVAMEQTRLNKGTLLRIEGPTGVGKTFAAGCYALLRKSEFLSNPVTEGSDFSDIAGGYAQSAEGAFLFNGETAVKKRLEDGGVVALSEMNTLLDGNDTVSLAWWLVQLTETPPDERGYKTIRLTEVPVAEGKEPPVIVVHPQTVVIIDTNPPFSQKSSSSRGRTAAYAARGVFPEIFKSQVPVVTVEPFLEGLSGRFIPEIEKLKMYARYFSGGDSGFPAEKAARAFWFIMAAHAEGKVGKNENVVFSLRDFKRFCDDVKGGSVEEAARVHLISRWISAEAQKAAVDILKTNMGKDWKASLATPVSMPEFMLDQVLKRKRFAHLQVSQQTDVRDLFRQFVEAAKGKKTDVRFLPMHDEIDRYTLEGGLAPTEEGDRSELLNGILGKLMQQAAASPDKEFVWVLDNAHNLRAETIVALNEILQTRKLYIKGRESNLRWPPNAHLVLVSREPVSWSPAEKSRFIPWGVANKGEFLLERVKSRLFPLLRQSKLSSLNQDALVFDMEMFIEAFNGAVINDPVAEGRASEKKLTEIVETVRKKLNALPRRHRTEKKILSLLETDFYEPMYALLSTAKQGRIKAFLGEQSALSLNPAARSIRIHQHKAVHGTAAEKKASRKALLKIGKRAQWRNLEFFFSLNPNDIISAYVPAPGRTGWSFWMLFLRAGSWAAAMAWIMGIPFLLSIKEWTIEVHYQTVGINPPIMIALFAALIIAGTYAALRNEIFKKNESFSYPEEFLHGVSMGFLFAGPFIFLPFGGALLLGGLLGALGVLGRYVLLLETRVVRGMEKQPEAPVESQLLVLPGNQALNLATGDIVSFEFLREQSTQNLRKMIIDTTRSSPVPSPDAPKVDFTPRYGSKPFIFLLSDNGKIVLNFQGRLFPTRLTLVNPDTSGQKRVLDLEEVLHPGENRPFTNLDFLYETPRLTQVERAVLDAFENGWHVDLEGKPGGGKTSIAREVALLLGLPGTVFQMHGERELADWIGSFREDSNGRIKLTSQPWIDGEGRMRFRQPLLDQLVNGGVFVADEGAIGDKGVELMSWLSSIVHGDKELWIEEFPGRSIRIPVSPDFHLIITNNSPEDTHGRRLLKSEISGNVRFIPVSEDDGADVLQGLFVRFLGTGTSLLPAAVNDMKETVGELHHELKKLIGSTVGKENRDRHYISKREVRRIAKLVRLQMLRDPNMDPGLAFFAALQVVYEAMFPQENERGVVRAALQSVMSARFPEAGTYAGKILENAKANLANHTDDEALVAHQVDFMFDAGEPVLLISQHGARTPDVVRNASLRRNATVIPIDAGPEHSELEVLGGLFPILDPSRRADRRSEFVRGAITRHLMTRDQMEKARSQPPQEQKIIWIRNIDQWTEDIRTALNGFLEDGYIDLEIDEGRIVRYYKPPHVHFIAEINDDSKQDFSSAFFNRWVKIGVSRDSTSPKPAAEGTLPVQSDMRKVMREKHGLDSRESDILTKLAAALIDADAAKRWREGIRYSFSNDVAYMAAEAVALAKRADPEWRSYYRRQADSGYNPALTPSQAPPEGTANRALWQEYRRLVLKTLLQEIRNVFEARIIRSVGSKPSADLTYFQKLLTTIFNEPLPDLAAPELTVDEETGIAASIGGIDLRPTQNAVSPKNVPADVRLRPTKEVNRVFTGLARANSLGRVAALVGETGTAKTTVSAYYAKVTGKDFYKYQSHAGSEAADLAIDIEQDESGEFRRRVKEFYAWLKKGNVVIDIDEANINPLILWILEPILQGESVIYPIFPGEEPFTIGPNVQIILTFNPTGYSGRSDIPDRILERCSIISMEMPTEEEMARIIETFYGIWLSDDDPDAQPLEEEKQSEPEPEPAPAPQPVRTAARPVEDKPAEEKSEFKEPKVEQLATEADSFTSDYFPDDNNMVLGRDVIDPSTKPQQREKGEGEPKEPKYGIFDPNLYPRTRMTVYDTYDGDGKKWTMKRDPAIPVNAPRLEPAALEEAKAAKKQTHTIFTGRYVMDLSDGQWHLLPSAGADMDVLSLEADAEIRKDSLDNYYIRARQPAAGDTIVVYHVAVPKTYYGKPIQKGLPFKMPPVADAEVREALTVIGITGDETDFRDTVHKLVHFFRDFALKADGIEKKHASPYLNIIHSRVGVCRHRTSAFVRTALAMGIPTRFVLSEKHAFAEVLVPGRGWKRIDLGGGGDPANMDLEPMANRTHVPEETDGLPKPENYKKDAAEMEKRKEEAMKAQNIEVPKDQPMDPDTAEILQEQAEEQEMQNEAAEDERVSIALTEMAKDLDENISEDSLSDVYNRGKSETGFVFDDILKALRSRWRIFKKAVRAGLEIDPLAFMLRKPKQFIQRVKRPKIQITAVSILLDISSSMKDYYKQLEFVASTVGWNFWKLKNEMPQQFFYDVSTFTDQPKTYVNMDERLSAKENSTRIMNLARGIYSGQGTDIYAALESKLNDFIFSPNTKNAKVKTVMFFTDGSDLGSISGGRFTPRFAELMKRYQEAGIDIIAVGFGFGASDVQAFNGPRQHFVIIPSKDPMDIAKSFANITKNKLIGSGVLPPGDISSLLNIEEAAPGALGFWKKLGITNLMIIAFLEGVVIALAALAAPHKLYRWLVNAHFNWGVLMPGADGDLNPVAGNLAAAEAAAKTALLSVIGAPFFAGGLLTLFFLPAFEVGLALIAFGIIAAGVPHGVASIWAKQKLESQLRRELLGGPASSARLTVRRFDLDLSRLREETLRRRDASLTIQSNLTEFFRSNGYEPSAPADDSLLGLETWAVENVQNFNESQNVDTIDARLAAADRAGKAIAIELSDNLLNGKPLTAADEGALAVLSRRHDGPIPVVVPRQLSPKAIAERLARVRPSLAPIAARLVVVTRDEITLNGQNKLSADLLAAKLKGARFALNAGLDLFILNRDEWADLNSQNLVTLLLLLDETFIYDATKRVDQDLREIIAIALQA